MSPLRPGLTHLYVAPPEALLSAVPQHDAWLSSAERARAERYRRAEDGNRYRATRVLIRGILGGLLAQPPASLAFEENAHGRPSLKHPSAALDFNASRARSWVALVVTSGAGCGVDVEDVSRDANFLGIARAFAPAERALLEAASPEERRRAFFSLWTLKEATLKALGTGLSLSLGVCAFHLGTGGPPQVTFHSPLREDAAQWRFQQFAPDTGHALAVAVRSGEPLDVAVHGADETCGSVAKMQ